MAENPDALTSSDFLSSDWLENNNGLDLDLGTRKQSRTVI